MKKSITHFVVNREITWLGRETEKGASILYGLRFQHADLRKDGILNTGNSTHKGTERGIVHRIVWLGTLDIWRVIMEDKFEIYVCFEY